MILTVINVILLNYQLELVTRSNAYMMVRVAVGLQESGSRMGKPSNALPSSLFPFPPHVQRGQGLMDVFRWQTLGCLYLEPNHEQSATLGLGGEQADLPVTKASLAMVRLVDSNGSHSKK